MRVASTRESAKAPRPEPRTSPIFGRSDVLFRMNCAAVSASVNWSVMSDRAMPQRLKPNVFTALLARLKPCPSTSARQTGASHTATADGCLPHCNGRRGALPLPATRLQVAIGEMAAMAVAFEPIMQKRLIEVRRDNLLAEFVRLSADEGNAQAREHGDERLRNAVGTGGSVRIF